MNDAATSASQSQDQARFDALFAAVGRERFFEEYFDKKPLHLPGAVAAPEEIMSWAELQRLLDMTSIWSPALLRMVLDRQSIRPIEYCREVPALNGQTAMQPAPEKVQALLRRGASVVLNDVDRLNPGLAAVSRALQVGTGGLAQGNLYCSRSQHQAFAPHYDYHDVYAVHCAGTKLWHVYDTRAPWPIQHPRFQPDEAQREKEKGDILMEVELKPGDLLYLPRGQYHDALASGDGAIHIAFGVTQPKGVDLMAPLFQALVEQESFRHNLPRDPEALAQHLKTLAEDLSRIVASEGFAKHAAGAAEAYPFQHQDYDLGAIFGAAPGFELASEDFSVVHSGGKVGLKGKGPGGRPQAVELPAAVVAPTEWVLARRAFDEAELTEAFPEMEAAARQRFLADLQAMKVIRPA